MIKKIFKIIKGFFLRRKSYKTVHKICEHPIFLHKVGRYVPCCKCQGCKNLYDLVKTQEYIEKYKRSSPWVTKY